MKCLCCGKPIEDTAAPDEKKSQWHGGCVRAFFGTEKMPDLDLSEGKLEELADRTVSRGLTVPGVQKKLSLHLSEDKARLTIVDYPTGYILKPQAAEYAELPQQEHLAMRLAETAGIETVPHALIKIRDQYAYITKRIDREIKEEGISLYAMEDFCQLSGRLTQDKYKSSYEHCGRIIKRYSVCPREDLARLFVRVVFSFVIGNSDMHLKNFSLREREPGGREFCLSEAYDMLPVNVVLPEDREQFALTLNGKKRNIRKKDFFALARSLEIPEEMAESVIREICLLKDQFERQCEEACLSGVWKERVRELIGERVGGIV